MAFYHSRVSCVLTKQSHESDLLKAQETDFDTKRRLLLFPPLAVCQCEWVLLADGPLVDERVPAIQRRNSG